MTQHATTELTTFFNLWADLTRTAPGLLAPITTEQQNEEALEAIDALMVEVGQDAEHPLVSLLSFLGERVAAFESTAYPVQAAPPNQVLEFLMAQHHVTQKQLEAEVGIDQGNLSKLIKGTREFSVKHIKALSRYFHVSADAFLA